VHTRKAGGDGCTVTMTCSRSITTRPTDIMADGYHGRHYRIHHARWATDMQHLQGQSPGRDSFSFFRPSRARVGLSRLRKLQGRTDGRVHGRRAGSCKPWQG
jgi:hypothetical protein